MKKTTVFKKCTAVMLSVITAASLLTAGATASAAERTPKGYISEYKSFADAHADAINTVVKSMFNMEDTVDIEKFGLSKEEISKVFEIAVDTTPELFFVDNNYSMSYYVTNGKKVYTDLYLYYLYSADTADAMLDEFYAKADEYLGLVDDSMSDFKKAVVLHDAIALHSYYQIDGSSNYTQMVQGFGKCENYSEVYAYLLANVGIKSEIVVSEAMNHEWLKVCIDGEYYNVDLTWDDPTPNSASRARHKFFLLSDELIQNLDASDDNHYDYTSEFASGTRFDNFYFQGVDRQLCFVDNDIYVLENDSQNHTAKLYKYDYTTDGLETVKTFSYIWMAGEGSYYLSSYMGLAAYDGMLYYNSPDAVYRYDVATGEEKVFAVNTYGKDFYDLYILDNQLYAIYGDSPSSGRTTVLVGEIGDEPALELGDVNGDGTVNIVDATAIQKYIASLVKFSAVQRAAADYNKDGVINIIDVTAIQKKVAGLIA